MKHTVALEGCHLYMTITREDGVAAEAMVHVEKTGTLGVSKPVWADAQELARQAIPVLAEALAAIAAHAVNDDSWVSAPEEGSADGAN